MVRWAQGNGIWFIGDRFYDQDPYCIIFYPNRGYFVVDFRDRSHIYVAPLGSLDAAKVAYLLLLEDV